MMEILELKVGSILHIMELDENYRVIYRNGNYSVTILMNERDDKVNILEWFDETILEMVDKKELAIRKAKYEHVFDSRVLSDTDRDIYVRNKDIVDTLSERYGPCYFDIATRKPKPAIENLAKKYNVSTRTVFYVLKKYLMSGLDPYALLPQQGKRSKVGMEYSLKTGRPPLFTAGVPLTNELREIFDDCCKHYLSGREKSYTTTYDWMCTKYFMIRQELQTKDGVMIQNQLMPIDQRPTINQMVNYIRNNTTEKQRQISKTSKREYRNDNRALISDNLYNVKGPGDLFEMDEVEMDVSLISEIDPSKVVGRPIVHAMVDVYSRMITAISVSLDNNSVLGFTNCLLNLGEDNKQLCRRFGLEIKEGLWDINVLPNRIRSDRGVEYRSYEVKRICNELNITLELTPPAMGSLKGQVEQLFHQYHSFQNDLLEGKGLITKRHDSNHHKHAVLTLEDIWVFVINQTIAHNMRVLKDYPLTKDMIQRGVHPVPLEIWKYGCELYGAPKPITNLDQFEYTLRREVKASITRKGIEWNGLYYTAEDAWLGELITKSSLRSSTPLNCRLDERDVGSLWYINDNRIVKARLNPYRSGNSDFDGKPLKCYEEYKTRKNELIHELDQNEQEIQCAERMSLQAAIDNALEAGKYTVSDSGKTKNIRQNRKDESISFMEQNSMGSRLDTKESPPAIALETKALPEPEAQPKEDISNLSLNEVLEKMSKKM